jgi:hypothetical protein
VIRGGGYVRQRPAGARRATALVWDEGDAGGIRKPTSQRLAFGTVESQTTCPMFDRHAAFDPAGDFEAFLKGVPAKWAVYLFTDADDRPVQLLCVKNLRYSLERRLGAGEDLGPTKRVNYRELVRNVRWVRVHSNFEADWVYLEVARRVFPKTYQGMLGFRDACSRGIRRQTT